MKINYTIHDNIYAVPFSGNHLNDTLQDRKIIFFTTFLFKCTPTHPCRRVLIRALSHTHARTLVFLFVFSLVDSVPKAVIGY